MSTDVREIKRAEDMTKEEIRGLLDHIGRVIESAEACKNAYFWEGLRFRDWAGKKYTVPCIEWEEGGRSYSAEYHVSCPRRNVYAYGYYYRDDEKTTLTAIRNSYKRIQAIYEKIAEEAA